MVLSVEKENLQPRRNRVQSYIPLKHLYYSIDR